jgi:hypothetical protein
MTLFPALDFDRFHTHDLPAQAAGPNGRLAAPYAAGLPPLAFQLPDGRAYTIAGTDDGVTVTAGTAHAGTVVDLSAADWHAFAVERFTRYGLLYNGRIEFSRGEFDDLCRWEPALRALFHGRPVFDPDTVVLTDRSGHPLDLTRAFGLDDDPADAAHFLQTAGYLHVRGVFDAHEVAALDAEIDRLAAAARPDDVHSWWTKTAAGEPTVCQLKYGARDSARITALHDDPRVQAMLAFAERDDMAPNLDRNEGTKIIFKHAGASEGLTDLPLHTDCGMGFHPVACPMVLIGVQLDQGTPATGQLHMVAGSHLATTPDPVVADTSRWPIVALATEPGDCTVHFSHTLHAAPPPATDPGGPVRARRTIYPCFAPPALFDALAPYEDLVAVMQRDDGVTMTVEARLAAR